MIYVKLLFLLDFLDYSRIDINSEARRLKSKVFAQELIVGY